MDGDYNSRSGNGLAKVTELGLAALSAYGGGGRMSFQSEAASRSMSGPADASGGILTSEGQKFINNPVFASDRASASGGGINIFMIALIALAAWILWRFFR